jgi:hypothetical protein
MQGQLWIEPVGNVLIARMRGMPDQRLLQDCQSRIIDLVKDTRQGLILHDCLEMETPQVEVPVSQWKLDQEIGSIHLKRAVVVPNTKLAYLARLAFGEGDVRVFYNDMAAALAWLTSQEEENRPLAGKSEGAAPSLTH